MTQQQTENATSQQLTWVLTWEDGEPWGSLLSIKANDQREWHGFVRLTDSVLMSLSARVDTILGPDGLRRITWTSSAPAAAAERVA